MAGSQDDGDDGDGREWRFALEEFDDSESEGGGEVGGNVAGALTGDEPLEPGSIDLENALFVLAGVLLAIGFLASAVLAL